MKFKIFLSIILLIFILGIAPIAIATVDTEALIAQLKIQLAELTQQLIQLQTQESGTDSWCYTFTSNLGFANSGSVDVVNLHLALQQEGISYSPDGLSVYSTATAASVAKFQKNHNISQTGYVGTLTRAMLNYIYGCSMSTSVPVSTNQTTDEPAEESTSSDSVNDSTSTGTTVQANDDEESESEETVTQIKCLSDSDCGTPGYISSAFCTGNKAYKTYRTYRCYNPGSYNSYCSYSSSNILIKSCASGEICSDGSCITQETGEDTGTDDTVTVTTCTPNWLCASWSSCSSSGIQTRICTDLNKCGTIVNKPSTSQSCTSTSTSTDTSTDTTDDQASVCTTNWACEDWGSCIESESDCYTWSSSKGYYRLPTSACAVGYQTRSCSDLNNCSVANRTCASPITKRYCRSSEEVSISNNYSEKTSSGNYGAVSLNKTSVYKGETITMSWQENTGINTQYVVLQKGGSDFDEYPLIAEKAEISSGNYQYEWSVPFNTASGDIFPAGNNYSIKITDTYGNIIAKSSSFVIASNSNDKYIDITYPNEGEALISGKTYTIRWNTNMSSETLYLYFRNFDYDNISYDLASSLYPYTTVDDYGRADPMPLSVNASAGSYSFTIPQPKIISSKPNWRVGDRYKILAIAYGANKSSHDDDVYDVSGYFSVDNTTCPIPEVALTESLSNSLASDSMVETLSQQSASLLDSIKGQLASLFEVLKSLISQ